MCKKSDILCSGCQQKLERGEITQTDVDLVRAINKINLDADFIRSVESGRKIYVIAGKEDSRRLVGKQGRSVNQLSSLLKKDMQIIKNDDEKKMIENILSIPVIAINIVYSSEETRKIRIEKSLRNKLKAGERDLEKIFGKKYSIVFE
jgi:transcription antitermination factor NusA-like protein